MAKVIGEIKFYPYTLLRRPIYVLRPENLPQPQVSQATRTARGRLVIQGKSASTGKTVSTKATSVKKAKAQTTKTQTSNAPLLLAFLVLSATIYTSLKS